MSLRLRSRLPQEPGWVYVLTNPSLPGCVKIGGPGRPATHRARELVAEYGAAAAFQIRHRHAVADWHAVEQAAHRMLSDRRLPRSELFEVSPREASRVIRAAAAAYARPWGLSAWLRRLSIQSPSSRRRYGTPWRRRGTNWIPALLVLSVAVAILSIERPALPSWLPVPVAHTLERVERM